MCELIEIAEGWTEGTPEQSVFNGITNYLTRTSKILSDNSMEQSKNSVLTACGMSETDDEDE